MYERSRPASPPPTPPPTWNGQPIRQEPRRPGELPWYRNLIRAALLVAVIIGLGYLYSTYWDTAANKCNRGDYSACQVVQLQIDDAVRRNLVAP